MRGIRKLASAALSLGALGAVGGGLGYGAYTRFLDTPRGYEESKDDYNTRRNWRSGLSAAKGSVGGAVAGLSIGSSIDLAKALAQSQQQQNSAAMQHLGYR